MPGLQLLADLALMPSDGFSFQARSIVRMSARRLFSATARKCAIICSFCQTARLDGQCFGQCHWVGFLIFSSFLAAPVSSFLTTSAKGSFTISDPFWRSIIVPTG